MSMKFNLPRHSLIGLLLISSWSNADTLVELYNKALENDPQLKADTAAYQSGLEQKAIARAGLLPSVNGSVDYGRNHTDTDSQGPQNLSGTIIPSVISSNHAEGDTTTYSATLNQPLFDMNRWYTFKRGATLSDQAEMQFLADQQTFTIRVAEAYFNVLRAIDTLETAIAEEAATGSQLEQTQQRYEVGLTAITDVHEAQAAADGSKANTLVSRGNLGVAYEALEVLTGQSQDSIAPILENFPVQSPMPADRSEWVTMALKNNYSLAVAKLAADSSEYTAKASKANHLPTLGASVTYRNSDNNTDTRGLPATSVRLQESTSVGVRLDIPIYNGGGVSARRRAAYSDALRAEELYNKAHRDTVQSTRSLYLTVDTSAATVNALAQQIISSTSALEATQAGYEVGTRTLVDVLIAQRTLYEAQRRYYDALYSYILSTLRLKQASGVLTVDDLNELNNWLDANNQVERGDFQ